MADIVFALNSFRMGHSYMVYVGSSVYHVKCVGMAVAKGSWSVVLKVEPKGDTDDGKFFHFTFYVDGSVKGAFLATSRMWDPSYDAPTFTGNTTSGIKHHPSSVPQDTLVWGLSYDVRIERITS